MDDSLLGECNSGLYERYAAVAARRLETDAEFQRARDEWEPFFIDSLYFDCVVDRLIRAAEREFGFALVNREATHNTAFLRSLYEAIIPRELRLALGEYYTPRGVAELAVADPPVDRPDSASFLDPGCGSGVFLAVCIEQKIESLSDRLSPRELVDAITDTVLGIDPNPVAVKSAKLSYLVSLLPLLDRGAVDRLELPVFLTDGALFSGSR